METDYIDEEEFAWLESVCAEAEAKRQRRNSNSGGNLVPSVTAPAKQAPQLPVISFTGGHTFYLDDVDAISSAATRLSSGTVTTLGFDIEWRVTFQTGAPPRPVALIQLCFKDPRLPSDAQYTCFLLHVCRCPAGLPAPLTALLANPAIAKVGVGIYQDAHKLKNDFVVEMGGLIELSDHANARLADPAAGKLPQRWSLAALTERLLEHRMIKNQSVRCSNWEQHPLSTEQRSYAATDAWVSLRLWEELEKLPVTWDAAAHVARPPAAAKTPSEPAILLPERPDWNRAQNVQQRKMEPDLKSEKRVPVEFSMRTRNIPACPAPAPLQPAKAAALSEHRASFGIVEIALQRRIQPATVMGYIAECIVSGHEYVWGWLERDLPTGAVALAARIAADTLEVEARGEKAARGLVMPEAQRVATEMARCYRPVDLLAEVVAVQRRRMKELQAEMEAELPGMGFGEMRLAFAHLGRCNPTWSREWSRVAPAPGA